MKKLVLAMVCVALTACGGGGGNTTPAITSTPAISGLNMSPTSAALNQGGGTIRVNFDFAVSDLENDVTTGNINVFNSSGQLITNFRGPATISNGRVFAYVMVDTTVRGNYVGELYVEDAQQHVSNKISVPFPVN